MHVDAAFWLAEVPWPLTGGGTRCHTRGWVQLAWQVAGWHVLRPGSRRALHPHV